MKQVIKQIDYQLIEHKIATPKGSCFSGDLLWRQGKDKSEMQTVELKSLAKSTDEYDLYDYANKMVPEWELHDQAYIEAQEQAKEQEKIEQTKEKLANEELVSIDTPCHWAKYNGEWSPQHPRGDIPFGTIATVKTRAGKETRVMLLNPMTANSYGTIYAHGPAEGGVACPECGGATTSTNRAGKYYCKRCEDYIYSQ